MFLLNGLVVLFFSPHSLIYPYAWTVLPLALFLSSVMLEKCRFAYLLLAGIAGPFLSSQPTGWTGYFLASNYFVSMAVPTILIGNSIVIASLIPIYLHPNTEFHRIEDRSLPISR
jgi:hypothetical protein